MNSRDRRLTAQREDAQKRRNDAWREMHQDAEDLRFMLPQEHAEESRRRGKLADEHEADEKSLRDHAAKTKSPTARAFFNQQADHHAGLKDAHRRMSEMHRQAAGDAYKE